MEADILLRRLPSVETLGAVDVICSDKTGTLTRNEMTARTIITADREYRVTGTGYEPRGDILHDHTAIEAKTDEVLLRLLQSVKACNNAEIAQDEEGRWKLTGPPTEGALLALSLKAGLKDFNPERIDNIPFESDQKYTATLNKIDDEVFVFLTGAPEWVLDMCSRQLSVDGETEIDADYWDRKMEAAAAEGQRLLGAAFTHGQKPNGIEKG